MVAMNISVVAKMEYQSTLVCECETFVNRSTGVSRKSKPYGKIFHKIVANMKWEYVSM